MTDDVTPRLALPMLRPGQAQKEWTHNEALALIDLLVQPSVEGVAVNDPPAAPAPGQNWIVGRSPTGAWAGRQDCLAGWTVAGWRFATPVSGMTAWVAAAQAWARFSCGGGSGGWVVGELRGGSVIVAGKQVVAARQTAIASPTGGATIDGEARAAISAVLAALRSHGLIEPA